MHTCACTFTCMVEWCFLGSNTCACTYVVGWWLLRSNIWGKPGDGRLLISSMYIIDASIFFFFREAMCTIISLNVLPNMKITDQETHIQ